MRCSGVDPAGLPLTCSGHGVCSSMRDLARWEYDADSLQYTYDDVWDATMTYGCVCGTDYEGPALCRAKLNREPQNTGESLN